MNGVTQIVRVAHGSMLYGTSTPQSDKDYKGVHLPSGESILLQRAEDVIDRGVVAKEGTKNTAEAIDEQSFSVQKFYEMLMKGDTVATEILFAPPIWQSPLWPEVKATGMALLNRECKGFVGYCVRQAAKYGIKGSRMAAVKKLLDFLAPVRAISQVRLGAYEEEFREFAERTDHCAFVEINGLWHIECCDRKMPMTASCKDAYDVFAKVWENYGARARAAMTNEGIDWKAVSHAVRVAEQAIELFRTGHITFPRPNADVLLAIKQGECSYEDVSKLLEMLVQRVQQCSEKSILPEKSDRALAEAILLKLYKEQVQ